VPPTTVRPELSVVVPALDEAATLPALLATLAGGLPLPHEVVVADGGSTDGTAEVARARGARMVVAPRGRGRQLGAGANAARAEVLWFVHADARPDGAALREVAALAAGHAAGSPLTGAHAAHLAIDAPGAAYRIVEAGANLRSRLAALPYGDQGLLVARAHYQAVGGHPPWPLMEDVALVRALRRAGVPIRLLDGTITVSARRWQRDGVVRRTLGNWRLLARFLAGADPEALAQRYRS
jgi:rSAM/selenodomain-associated transferase 2